MRLAYLVMIALLVLPGRAFCWTSKTYQLVVVNAVKLMPESFRNIMYRHKEEILQGSLRPDNLGETAHVYSTTSRSGYLQDRVQELATEIPRKIHDHVPFRELAFDFGALSHYISDLNDPLVVFDSDPRESQYRVDFAIYVEKNIDKFPWVYYGHEDPLLKEGKIAAFVYEIASRGEKPYAYLGQSYFPKGTLVSSDTFDPKSLPFGIGSLSYSHAISNTIQVWFDVWRRAHADLERAPYRDRQREP
jgi:hypothetical protein